MAYSAIGVLKLELPGAHPDTIPTLYREHVNKVPAEFLELLYRIGDVERHGDVVIITIKDERFHTIVKRSAEFYATDRLEHGQISVERVSSYRKVPYKKDVHEQDTNFSATFETHDRFLEQVQLYISCLHYGMKDFQAYLSQTICTLYPVYKAEIMVLLAELYEVPENLEKADLAFLSYLSQRIVLFRDTLALDKDVTSFFRSKLNKKERFMSLAPRLSEAEFERALQVCRVEDSEETEAILNRFVGKYSTGGSLIPTARQAIDNSAVQAPTNYHTTQGRTHDTAPQALKHPRTSIASVLNEVTTPAEAMEQSSHQNQVSDKSHAPSDIYSGKHLRLKRPSAENEWWSITREEWNRLSLDSKRWYTHAGYISETEAGMLAPEPCSNCAEDGDVCEVYIPEIQERHKKAGARCGRCRLRKKKNGACSIAAAKRAKGAEDEREDEDY